MRSDLFFHSTQIIHDKANDTTFRFGSFLIYDGKAHISREQDSKRMKIGSICGILYG